MNTIRIGPAPTLGLAPLTPRLAATLGLRGPLSAAEEAAFPPMAADELDDPPGLRLAHPLTAIKRDGLWYAPDAGERLIPVDFKSFVELVEIGAVTDVSWHTLAPVATAIPLEVLAEPVAGTLEAIQGMTPQILAKLRQGGIVDVEGLAACATDDLVSDYGPAILDGVEVTLDDAQRLIIRARVSIGWITEG